MLYTYLRCICYIYAMKVLSDVCVYIRAGEKENIHAEIDEKRTVDKRGDRVSFSRCSCTFFNIWFM